MNFTGTRKTLHTALIAFIFTCIFEDEKTRRGAWNELFSLYGTRIVTPLGDIAMYAGECRIARAEARRHVEEINRSYYDKHLSKAKSVAEKAAETW